MQKISRRIGGILSERHGITIKGILLSTTKKLAFVSLVLLLLVIAGSTFVYRKTTHHWPSISVQVRSDTAQAQFSNDTYTDTSGTALNGHTPNVGSPILTSGSNGVISSTGTLYFNSTAAQLYTYSGAATAGAIWSAEWDIICKSTANTSSPYFYLIASTGIGYRILNLSGMWYFQTTGAGAVGAQAQVLVAGHTYHNKVTYNPSTHVFNWYIDTLGANFTLGPYTDSTYTPTMVAVGGGGQTATDTTGLHFDNLIAYLGSSFSLSAPPPTFSSVGITSLTVTSSAGGGTTPYSIQFQRAPDVSGSPGTFVNVGTASATTTYNDTGLTAGTNYWYRYVVTDSAGTPAIVTSSPASKTTNPVIILQVVYKGDSITYGTSASSGQGTTTGAVYPSITEIALGLTWTGTNKGVAGQQVTTMVTNGVTEIDALYNATTYPSGQIAVLLGGTNDIGATSNTAASIYASIVSWHTTRRSVGWKTVATTIPHSGYATGYTRSGIANFDPVCDAVNVLIRANWRTFANSLADFAADSRILDPTNATYFQSDQTHFTDAGYAILGQYEAAAILQAATSSTVLTGTKRKIQ